eukprot:2805053-Pleurochrysis_carterae.AAC.2
MAAPAVPSTAQLHLQSRFARPSPTDARAWTALCRKRARLKSRQCMHSSRRSGPVPTPTKQSSPSELERCSLVNSSCLSWGPGRDTSMQHRLRGSRIESSTQSLKTSSGGGRMCPCQRSAHGCLAHMRCAWAC